MFHRASRLIGFLISVPVLWRQGLSPPKMASHPPDSNEILHREDHGKELKLSDSTVTQSFV